MLKIMLQSTATLAVAAALLNFILTRSSLLYPHGTFYRRLISFVVKRHISTKRRDAARAAAEARRVKEGRKHTARVYHSVDDPHSHLLLHALRAIVARYEVGRLLSLRASNDA